MISISKLAGAAILTLSLTTPLFAQATRTWVSGLGDDLNPCSRTAPCKTFAGAIIKTMSGGEIDALDPAGYGTINITKPITIDGGSGQVGSILAAGTTGVIINTTGSSDTVVLRNISINGAGQTNTPGLKGVRIINGKNVHLENLEIFGFTQRGIGIETSAIDQRVIIKGCTVRSNSEGLASAPTSGNVILTVFDSTFSQNTGHAINLMNLTKASIKNSALTNNPGVAALIAQQSTVEASVTGCDLSGNGYGIYAGYLGGVPQVRLSQNVITSNTIQGVFLNGGTVTGFSSNLIAGNAGNNFVSMSIAGQ